MNIISTIQSHLFKYEVAKSRYQCCWAEQANIPKLSKLDDIGTLLRHFELFFDDALADMIVDYSNLCGHREKADTNFETTNEKFRSFLDMTGWCVL